jgi:multiple sugar transport system permease protein
MATAASPIPGGLPNQTRVTIRKRLGTVAYSLLVIVVCAITFFPIYWMIVSTVQPTSYSTHYPPPLLPKGVRLQAFRDLFEQEAIGSWLIHSTVLALLATAICVLLAVLGAYTISVMRWRGRSAFAIFLLMTQMLPEALIIVPIFKIYANFPLLHIDLRDNLAGLSLIDAAFVLPIGVWVLKNLFDTVPREVIEAARVDGAGPMRVLVEIILPITVPGLIAVGVVAFFYAWNEYLFAQLLVTSKSLYPASVGLASMKTMLDTPIEQLLAAGLIFAVPPVIFYVVMQRYIVAGITAGAVKG